jgi:hypothetical protein
MFYPPSDQHYFDHIKVNMFLEGLVYILEELSSLFRVIVIVLWRMYGICMVYVCVCVCMYVYMYKSAPI